LKLRKKLLLLGLAVFVISMGIFVYAYNPNDDANKLTNYSMDAVLVSQELLSVKETIEYTNNSEIDIKQLPLHLYANAFRQDAVYKPYDTQEPGVQDNEYGGIDIKIVMVDGKLVIHRIGGVDQNILYIPVNIEPTKSINIVIEFDLRVPKINHRLGRSDNTINFGNWYPIVCVLQNGQFREDPYYSFGDPFFSDISNYDVNITVPSEHTVATTGMYSMTTTGNTRVYSMEADNIRDFAFVVSNKFEVLTDKFDGININYYFYDDPSATDNLQLIKDVLNTYNDKFGKYPYSVLSVVKTTFLHGGMEYPQIVYISDIVEPETYQEVIVHEIAHQWWYAVVGNDQIQSAWIDEGLSEYSTTIFYEFNPKYGITKQKRIAQALSNFLLYCDLNGYLHGKETLMEKSLGEFRSSMEYIFMIYVKGHLLFDSLRTTIGDKAFFEGIKQYYQDNALAFAKKENLIAAFESHSTIRLEKFFDSWTDGKVQILA